MREEERTSIAREIHDELGQQLTGLKMDISWLTRKLVTDDPVIKERTKEMIELADETVKTVRRISSDLRPGILDDLGLIAALEWQCAEFEKRSGIKSAFSASVTEVNCDRNLATGIFRVYQEALTNVMRHSGASKVDSTLAEKGSKIILTITDNGKGFDLFEAKNKKTLGLLGMQERARMFGGELNIISEKNKGTTITLAVSVAPHTN